MDGESVSNDSRFYTHLNNFFYRNMYVIYEHFTLALFVIQQAK